jgi:tetratricopeptide (TPR) repeat protein
MVEETERPARTDDSPGTELAALVAGLPRRAAAAHAFALGRAGDAVAERVEALGADELAALGDDVLLGAGAVLLAHDRGELAARCYAALEPREAVAGLARLGLAWVSWAAGEAQACAEGLKAAAELDATLALVPAGTELRAVRARAGAIMVLSALDAEGEHDVERIVLPRPLLAAERTALAKAAEGLAGLAPPAVAGYGALALEPSGARLRREPVPGKPLSASLDQPRSLDEALAIVVPLCEGLVAAHAKGVTHGAIHPALVTLAPAGAVLRGLGLHTLEVASPGDAAQGFVAPERRGGAAATPKADAYALAALLYLLVTGQPAVGSVPRPSTLALDPRLDELFADALHPDPGARLDVATLRDRAKRIAATPGQVTAVGAAPSQPIAIPTEAGDLDGWARILDRKPTHREALDAVAGIEAEARKNERWDQVAEVLALRAKLSQVQQERVALRRELVRTYETKLGAPASAFRELQALIEEVPVVEQIALVAELRRVAEITGQWGPLADSLEIVAQRAPDPAEQSRLYTGLGRVYAERLGASDRALAAYEQAIGLEANAGNLTAAAPLYRKAGKLPELVATLLNLADHQQGEAKAHTLREAADVLHDELGDAEGAFATLRAALEEEPGHAGALAKAEAFARELEDWDGLVDLLDKRAAASLDDEVVRSARSEAAALAAERLGDPARAVAQLEQILARDGKHEPTLRRRVELLRTLTETDAGRRTVLVQALGALAERVERPEDQAALWTEQATLLEAEAGGKADAARARERVLDVLGLEHASAQQAAEALERWYRREEQTPALIALLRRVGQDKHADDALRTAAWAKLYELRKTGAHANEDAAVEALEALTALAPTDHAWRDALLERYLARGEADKAGPLIRQQVSDEGIDPKRKAALLWRGGKLREQLGKAEGAVEALEEAVALDPGLHDAWLALRDLYRQREQPLKAIDAQVSAGRAHPSRTEKVSLLFDAAKTFLDVLGQPDKGLQLLEELVQVDPDHREATGMLVQRLVADGDLVRAWPVAQTWVAQVRAQARDDKAQNVRALSIAGRCAVAAEEPERAREYLEKVRQLDATNLDVLRLLGEMDMEAERWEDALKSYQSVVLGAGDKLPPPELSQVYLQMAQARLGMKERMKAIQLVERALDIHPEQRAAVEKLVELADGPAERVKAKQRLAELLARREAKLTAPDQQAVHDEAQAERIALLQEIAQIQAKELQAPADAARTLEAILELSPTSTAVLHGLMETFTQAGRWRDVTRVLELLAAQQTDAATRAKYLYAGAAILRDQLADAEGYGQWVLRVLEADPGHAKANRGYADHLEKKGAWKDLAKHLRNRLKALPKDATADDRIGLFVALGEVYEGKLGDGKTALAAYEQAVRFTPPEREDAPETKQRRTKIMELALSFGDDELDKAIAQGHALVAIDPSDFATYHRLVELYQRRKQEDPAVTHRAHAGVPQAGHRGRAGARGRGRRARGAGEGRGHARGVAQGALPPAAGPAAHRDLRARVAHRGGARGSYPRASLGHPRGAGQGEPQVLRQPGALPRVRGGRVRRARARLLPAPQGGGRPAHRRAVRRRGRQPQGVPHHPRGARHAARGQRGGAQVPGRRGHLAGAGRPHPGLGAAHRRQPAARVLRRRGAGRRRDPARLHHRGRAPVQAPQALHVPRPGRPARGAGPQGARQGRARGQALGAGRGLHGQPRRVRAVRQHRGGRPRAHPAGRRRHGGAVQGPHPRPGGLQLQPHVLEAAQGPGAHALTREPGEASPR